MSDSLNSCLYEGWVRHRRMVPIEHEFKYRLFYVYLDLAELDHVFNCNPIWSTRRFNLAWFRRSDHLGKPDQPLDESVRDLVEARGFQRPTGPIRLLTHLRYFGYVINPVSFYYCFDKQDRFTHLVAEVTNTPWGERHCYVVSADAFSSPQLTPKTHHVSPFLPMDLSYRWQGRTPSETLPLHIENVRGKQKVMDVTMVLKKKQINFLNLNRVLLRNPLMTLQVLARIYWQAIRLKRKGAEFYAHPKHQEVESLIDPTLPAKNPTSQV